MTDSSQAAQARGQSLSEYWRMTSTQWGLWIWGTATVLLAISALLLVVGAGFYIVPGDGAQQYRFANAPAGLVGLFFAVKENASLVGGVLGFSGLAWSHFYSKVNSSSAKR